MNLARHVQLGPTLVDPARGHCYRLGVKTCKWNDYTCVIVANGSVVSLTYPVEADTAGKLALICYRSNVLEMILLQNGSPRYVGLSAAGRGGTGSYL